MTAVLTVSDQRVNDPQNIGVESRAGHRLVMAWDQRVRCPSSRSPLAEGFFDSAIAHWTVKLSCSRGEGYESKAPCCTMSTESLTGRDQWVRLVMRSRNVTELKLAN